MPTNDFLKFCQTDTGTNLLSQAEYLADAQRLIGNQPGVARSKLVNKAVRQSSFIVNSFAAYLAQQTGTDILDDEDSAALLAKITSVFSGGNLTIQNKSANYTALASDQLVLCNATSAAFTITLPTTGIVAGHILSVKKTLTDVSFNAVTISDGTFSTTVNTFGEEVTVYWNGTAWLVLDRYCPSTRTSYTPATTGFGSITSLSAGWSRSGTYMDMDISFQCGTTTGTTATCALPTGLLAASTYNSGGIYSLIGMSSRSASASPIYLITAPSDPNIYFANSSSGNTPNTGFNVAGASETLGLSVRLKIDGWQG